MEKTVKYPIGIQTFSEIIEDGYIYIDKTRYIKKLKDSGKFYFLSRPRRFGKSLLLSTMEAYFEGKRDLFKGLYIYDEESDWTSYPVLMFSFNTMEASSMDSLSIFLNTVFSRYERIYGKDPDAVALPQRFESLLLNAYGKTGRKVVVLIDEYDAPLLNTLDRPELNEHYRQILKPIFSVLKSFDRYIEFAFVTGVSRFSHTSLFSGANNLKDITLEDKFAGICGITEEELKEYLPTSIREFAQKQKISEEDAFLMLKENYDGYHFSEESPDIYNPYSLLNALDSRRIDDFWFKSGTPSYLIGVMKRDNFFLPDLDCIETLASGLSVKESYLNNPVALLFETGYLTIKSFEDEMNLYTLGLPNKEVAESFSKALMPIYSGYMDQECEDLLVKMRRAVVNGDAERFMEVLQTFLEGNPYGNTEMAKRESYFKNNIYIIFRALGFLPRAEEQTCRGRMDVMLRTRRFIYIFELKTDGSVSKAIDQIEDKGYADPYRHSDKTVIRIAANYSTGRNNIDSWEITSA
ncbi:MAG: ATP-binding protein [Muribaculaceae bacterium]|nr:ATP-binding protein [Muribaculaceae bacterium]